jgi:hypothetical protein
MLPSRSGLLRLVSCSSSNNLLSDVWIMQLLDAVLQSRTKAFIIDFLLSVINCVQRILYRRRWIRGMLSNRDHMHFFLLR